MARRKKKETSIGRRTRSNKSRSASRGLVMDDVVKVTGTPVNPSSLVLPRARSFAETLGSGCLDYVKLIECRQLPNPPSAEIVVIEVEVERPQSLANPIQRFERLAIVFQPDDSTYPFAWSLRKSFPRVKHLNFNDFEIPRDFCL